jgi:hypothetical protein
MRYIKVNGDNVVITTRIGEEIAEGESQSDVGECGDILQEDGTFLTPEPQAEGPSLEARVTAIEDALLMII